MFFVNNIFTSHVFFGDRHSQTSFKYDQTLRFPLYIKCRIYHCMFLFSFNIKPEVMILEENSEVKL